jgi:hypothetical protein
MAENASREAEDRLMLEKGIEERPRIPAPDAGDDSDSCYILSDDSDVEPQCDHNIPFATAVLFGLVSGTNDPLKSLNPKAKE